MVSNNSKFNHDYFPRQWEVWLVNFPQLTSEDRKRYRPMLIISDDYRNQFDRLVVGIGSTTKDLAELNPAEVKLLPSAELKLDSPCKLQFFYPRTIAKDLRLVTCLGRLDDATITLSREAWKAAFDLGD